MSYTNNQSGMRRIQVLTATIASFLLGSSLLVPVNPNLAYAQVPLISSDQETNNRDDLIQPGLPEFDFNNINKSIVVLLNFTALNKAEIVSSIVSYGPPHSNIGNPPLLRVQNYDHSGRIIQQFNYWHPLYALEFQEDGKEHLKILPSALGRFVFPFDPRIVSMNISYLHHDGPNSTRAEGVTTVDLKPTVANFCEQNPDDPNCRSSDLAIIDVSSTQGQQQLPILIGDSANVAVQTTITNIGPDTAIDATLSTRAIVPSGDDGIRVTPAAGVNIDENGEVIVLTSLSERQQHDHTYSIECWQPGKHNIIFESEITSQSGAAADGNNLNNKGQMNLEVDCSVIDGRPRGEPLTVSIQPNVTESGSPPTTIEFRAITDGGTQPPKIRWNFDDGSNASAERDHMTRHQFTQLGRYNVKVTVTDSANGYIGQTTSDNITITINDNEAPEINVPSYIIAKATDPNGAHITFLASARDKVDGPVSVQCSRPPSDSRFSVNITTVFCSASDMAGNIATKQFDVTVTPPNCAVENQDYYPVEGCVPDPSNCSDSSDNDDDGLIDSDDSDCYPRTCPGENQRYDPITAQCIVNPSNCSGNLDNDGDGLIDGNDPECYPPTCPAENQRYDPIEQVCIIDQSNCSDSSDNDDDGLIDSDDSDCTTITTTAAATNASTNQQIIQPPPQFPQISWNELEEVESFIANGKIDSTLYTINGNWKATGDWNMTVVDGELTSFNTTMIWVNGTAVHSHEFLNFEAGDDVDISAEDQTISIAGTMDVGTNSVTSWQEIPSEILIEAGRIITISLNDQGTNRHFGGQSVHGNLTSLRICSTTPGPAMQIFPAC